MMLLVRSSCEPKIKFGTDLRGCGCTASLAPKVHGQQVAVQSWSRKWFGQGVCWVGGAQHLVQAQLAGTHEALDPQLSNCQVPNLANPRSAANANGRRRIAAHANRGLDAQVAGEALKAQRLAAPSHDPEQLGLATGQGHGALSA